MKNWTENMKTTSEMDHEPWVNNWVLIETDIPALKKLRKFIDYGIKIRQEKIKKELNNKNDI